jgi:hypothetical protein
MRVCSTETIADEPQYNWRLYSSAILIAWGAITLGEQRRGAAWTRCCALTSPVTMALSSAQPSREPLSNASLAKPTPPCRLPPLTPRRVLWPRQALFHSIRQRLIQHHIMLPSRGVLWRRRLLGVPRVVWSSYHPPNLVGALPRRVHPPDGPAHEPRVYLRRPIHLRLRSRWDHRDRAVVHLRAVHPLHPRQVDRSL